VKLNLWSIFISNAIIQTFYKAYNHIGLQWITLAGNNDYKVPKDEQTNINENKNGNRNKHNGHHKNVHISEEEKKRIEKQEKNENFEKARERVLAQMTHSEMYKESIWSVL